MIAEKLAALLLKNPKAEVLIGMNESGCPISRIQKGENDNKAIVVLWVDEVQEAFLPECSLEKLK